MPSFMSLIAMPLVIALASQIGAQLIKVVIYSIVDRRLAFDRFVNAGGMPSAHTSFVTALTASIGMQSGFTSDVFAVSTVFSVIVIYDAFRLRGHVQKHAEVLNRLLKPRIDVGSGDKPLSEHVGHTLPEIGAGIVWGLLFAFALT